MRNFSHNNLSAEEGDAILKGVKVLIDILVNLNFRLICSDNASCKANYL